MKRQNFAMIPALGFLAYAEYWDAVTSKYFPLHTTGEANWISRGEDGYYSLKKSMTVTIAVSIGLTLAAYLLPHPAQYVTAGITAGIAAVIFFVIVKNNQKKQKEDKARQADFLENFQPSYIHPNTARLTVFKGEWIWKTFYDIRIPKLADVDDPTERLRACVEFRKIFEVLKANPNLWWSLDRAEKLKEIMGRV